MKFNKESAEKAQCFKRFNLLRDQEIDQVTLKKTYNKVYFLADPSKGGSTEEAAAINLAKKILSDPKSRENYIKALKKYDLPDGLERDVDFEPRLSNKRNEYNEKQRTSRLEQIGEPLRTEINESSEQMSGLSEGDLALGKAQILSGMLSGPGSGVKSRVDSARGVLLTEQEQGAAS